MKCTDGRCALGSVSEKENLFEKGAFNWNKDKNVAIWYDGMEGVWIDNPNYL
jgi:hypothetical protein